MPYSVASYADVGGSPFQQYLNQQQQNYFQQQQLNNQQQYLKQQQGQQVQPGQQGQQQNPAFGGQNPQLTGLGQQQYGPQQPGQYNPLPTYNQGNNLTRMANGGGYGAPQPTAAATNPDGSPKYLPPGTQGASIEGDMWTQNQHGPTYGPGGQNPYPTRPNIPSWYQSNLTPGPGNYAPQQYSPLQPYGGQSYSQFNQSPAGGTMNNFQYY